MAGLDYGHLVIDKYSGKEMKPHESVTAQLGRYGEGAEIISAINENHPYMGEILVANIWKLDDFYGASGYWIGREFEDADYPEVRAQNQKIIKQLRKLL